MCGIVAVLGAKCDETELRFKVLEAARAVRHRGPDWSGLRVQRLTGSEPSGRLNLLAHERLGIVAPEDGAQPLTNETGQIALTVNGEIYNHTALREQLSGEHQWATGSDCEVILHLFEEMGPALVDRLDGVFAFVLADESSGQVLAARDPIGVVPLYWGWGADGSVGSGRSIRRLPLLSQSAEPCRAARRVRKKSTAAAFVRLSAG